MASDHSDTIKVTPEELYDPSEGGFAGAPQVHVDKVQEVEPTQKLKDILKKEEEAQQTPDAGKTSAPVTHETDKVKTTSDQEEDGPDLSMKSKIKVKMGKLGDKLRPKEAVEAKNADPHPGFV